MKIIEIDFKRPIKTEINLIVDYLKRGKVIAYPTDTIYGIGCVATDKKAINRIYKIKKRNREYPLLVLASSLAMVKRYCYVSKKQEEYLRKVWARGMKLKSDFASPKSDFMGRPVSVILRSRGVLPKELTGGRDSLAVRLPNSQLLVKMIRQVNAPIVSTSLNVSGRENLTNVSEIEQYFKSPNLRLRGVNNKKSPKPLYQGGINRFPQLPLRQGYGGQVLFTKGGSNKGLLALVVDAGEIKGKSSKLIDLTDINNIKILRK